MKIVKVISVLLLMTIVVTCHQSRAKPLDFLTQSQLIQNLDSEDHGKKSLKRQTAKSVLLLNSKGL